MKMYEIQDVTFELKKYEFSEPFRITGWIHNEAENVDVKVVLKSGKIGMGEASPSYRVNGEKVSALMALQKDVKEMLIGSDVRNYRRIFEIMDGFSRTAPSVKAAVQYAILDSLSMATEMPVYQMLGGSKSEIKIDKTVGIDELNKMVEKAKRFYHEEGYETLKIKVGENLKEDVRKILAISDATKGASYVVDANQGYSVKEAIQFANATYENGVNIVVFEQPVIWNNLDGLKILRYNSPIPIAADESAKTKYDVYELIRNGCVDFINIKLMKSGISDALSIVELAKTTDTGLMIGCMSESSLGISQSVHFAAGIGAFAYHDLDSHMLLKERGFRGKFKQEGELIKL